MDTPTKGTSAKVAAEPPSAPAEETSAPTVIDAKKGKRKGKKKYSNSMARSFQELEAGLTKSSRRVAKAVREGLDAYQEERDKSAEAKKDGALRDILRNQSKALRAGLPIAAEAPSDLVDAIADMKVMRRVFKR